MREVGAWLALGAAIIVTFTLVSRRSYRSRQGEIELQQATTPLQPAVQPAILPSWFGASPSESSAPEGAAF